MNIINIETLVPWEALHKRMIIEQLGELRGKKILDFGSGKGFMANYYAQHNEVMAIEPDEVAIKERYYDYPYQQLVGSLDILSNMADETFDLILCHNVLEYAKEREAIVKAFYRLLKPSGKLSLIKHNRAGRIMQMVVLLNNFEAGHALLDGNTGYATQYGTIHYYETEEVMKWCKDFKISQTYGMRTFWDLQQNQEIQKDEIWQKEMLEMEQRVALVKAFQDIAFFHHIIFLK